MPMKLSSWWWRRLGLAMAAAALAVAAQATDAPDLAADRALEARVHAVAIELRCLVCQNQTIADSNADLAVDLKNQVREQLKAGRSERDVIDYMTQRYGDFVRYRPPFKASTALLWAGPALLVLIGAGLLWRTLRSSQAAPPAAAIDAADAARAEQLLAAADEPRR